MISCWWVKKVKQKWFQPPSTPGDLGPPWHNVANEFILSVWAVFGPHLINGPCLILTGCNCRYQKDPTLAMLPPLQKKVSLELLWTLHLYIPYLVHVLPVYPVLNISSSHAGHGHTGYNITCDPTLREPHCGTNVKWY